MGYWGAMLAAGFSHLLQLGCLFSTRTLINGCDKVCQGDDGRTGRSPQCCVLQGSKHSCLLCE